jgi:hypothetical protein
MTDQKRQGPIVECECAGCCGSSAPEDQPEPVKQKYVAEVGWVVNKLETPNKSLPAHIFTLFFNSDIFRQK